MTFNDITTVPTQTELETRIKAEAAKKGAQPDTWPERSLPSVMTTVLAYLLYLIYSLISDFAKGSTFGIYEDADESFVELHGKSQFNEPRNDAEFAVFLVRVSCEVGLGPHALSAGEFRIGTTWGLGFYNRDAGTVPSGGYLDMYFVADEAAAEYNVTTGQITSIQTPKAGVTISALSQEEAGADEELISDYVARCQGMWGGLGGASTEFVQNLAINSVDATLTKVITRVDSSTVGQMYIYLGTASAGAGGALVTAMQALIDSLQLFQAVTVVCQAAIPENVNVSGTVTAKAGRQTEAEADVSAALVAWQATLGYGDTIPISDFWRNLFRSEAISKVELAMPSEVSVDKWKLTVLVNNLTFQEEA